MLNPICSDFRMIDRRAAGAKERGLLLQVLRGKACTLGDASEHFRADLFGVVKGPGEIREARALELLVGAALDEVMLGPSDTKERAVDLLGLRTWPMAHAAANFTWLMVRSEEHTSELQSPMYL